MKLYCYYTRAYQSLVDEWLMPSIKKDCEVIFKIGRYDGPCVDFKANGWGAIVSEKVDFIIQAVKENWGKIFIFSDPDVQFLGDAKKILASFEKNVDMVFQKDEPCGTICAGFFVCVGTDRTLKLWQDVRSWLGADGKADDQDAANQLLVGSLMKKIKKMLPSRHLSKFLAIRLSQSGFNPYRLKWRYLPPIFFGGGTLTGRRWTPGMDLPVPDGIVLHHANWTVGMENKIAQLRYVRDIVRKRAALN